MPIRHEVGIAAARRPDLEVSLLDERCANLSKTSSGEELSRPHELLRAVLTASPEAIEVLDRDGVVEVWNPAAEELFGARADEVVGRRLAVSDQEALDRDLEAVRTGESFTGRLVRTACRGGEERLLSVSRAPLRDSEGRITGSVGLYHDVTEQRRLEAQLVQSRKMEALGRLAGGIAHEFNNVLAAMRGFSAALIDDLGTGGQVGEDLAEIVAAVDRAAALTRKLAAFSRRKALSSEEIELDRVIRSVQVTLRRILGEDVELVVRLSAEGAHILADAAQIEQVLVNLVANARDAMPDGGTLAIETRAATRETGAVVVELHVRDTGAGMDEATRARAFDPFFTTKPIGNKGGFGLATVYAIATQNGGTIALESAPGEGTAVTIAFPRFEPPSHARVRRDDAAPSAPVDDSEVVIDPAEATVLVVEDEELVRRLVCRVLEERGYGVLSAADGEEALVVVRDRGGRIDALLTDVVMPKMGGPELARSVLQGDPTVQVIYMSGYVDERVIDPGALHRAHGLIHKPFSRGELLELVARALAARATG